MGLANKPTGTNVGGGMQACGNNQYCCGGDFNDGRCNCAPGNGAFTVRDGKAQTIVGVPGSPPTGAPTLPSAPSGQPTPKATSVSPSPGPTPGDASRTQTGTVTAGIPTNTGNDNNSTDTPPPVVTDTIGFKAGIGAGAGALALAALGVGLYLWHRKDKKNQESWDGNWDDRGNENGNLQGEHGAQGHHGQGYHEPELPQQFEMDTIPGDLEADPNQGNGGFRGHVPYSPYEPLGNLNVHGSPPLASNPFNSPRVLSPAPPPVATSFGVNPY